MNYHPDDFLALIEEVEAQGGAHLSSESCTPHAFRINQPTDPDNPSGSPMRNVLVHTSGCRRRAQFLVGFLPDEKGVVGHEDAFDFDDEANPGVYLANGEPALAKVCAVDDAMGLWPRFRNAMHTGMSFQE